MQWLSQVRAAGWAQGRKASFCWARWSLPAPSSKAVEGKVVFAFCRCLDGDPISWN